MVSRKNGDEITESHNAKQKIITAMLVTIQTKKENSNVNNNIDNNRKCQQQTNRKQ